LRSARAESAHPWGRERATGSKAPLQRLGRLHHCLLLCSAFRGRLALPLVAQRRHPPAAFVAFSARFVHHAACLSARPHHRRGL